MKFGAVIPVLNEWRFVPAVVAQLLKVAERCVIVRSPVAFSGEQRTLDPAPGLPPRVEVLTGDWPTPHAMRNAGIQRLSECDYVFTLDSDEVLLDHDLFYLRDVCERGGKRHKAIATSLFTYWKTPEYRIDPPEPLIAVAVVRQDVRFVNDRRVRDGDTELAGCLLHHLSYVRTDEEVREKLAISAHAREVADGWYERVWKGWDQNHDLRHLHPTHPSHYRRAVHDPNPELLRVLAGCWP